MIANENVQVIIKEIKRTQFKYKTQHREKVMKSNGFYINIYYTFFELLNIINIAEYF